MGHPLHVSASCRHPPAHAQEVSAELTGRVTDASPAAPSPKLPSPPATWSAALPGRLPLTSEEGIFTFPRIPNGKYTLKVEAQGFKTFVHPGIELEINQHGRVDIVLQLGSVNETVEVTEEAALLQTETTQVGVVVGAQTIDDTPLMSRNLMELTLLIPGVTATDPSTFNTGTRADASGGRPFVNGNREQANNFLLDGVDAQPGLRQPRSHHQPSPDAIQEMKVITNNASAEFGNFQGGVINMVIKSGTNKYHGTPLRAVPQRQAERR